MVITGSRQIGMTYTADNSDIHRTRIIRNDQHGLRKRWWNDSAEVTTKIAGVFEGGGAKGLAYAGVMRALKEDKVWFSSVAGASAGAITAALVAAGYQPDELKAFTEQSLRILGGKSTSGTFGRILMKIENCRRLSRYTGYFDSTDLRLWLMNRLSVAVKSFIDEEELKKCAGDPSNPTFEMLFRATGIDVYIVAANITAQELITFSHYTTPVCQVADAVIASSAVPLVFESGQLNVKNLAHTIVDGGVWSNFPMFVFTDASFRKYYSLPDVPEDESVVGFLLEEERRFTRDEQGRHCFEPKIPRENPLQSSLAPGSFWLELVRFEQEKWLIPAEWALVYDDYTNTYELNPNPDIDDIDSMEPPSPNLFLKFISGVQGLLNFSNFGTPREYRGRWPGKNKFASWVDLALGTIRPLPIGLAVWAAVVVTLGLVTYQYFGSPWDVRVPLPFAAPQWFQNLSNFLGSVVVLVVWYAVILGLLGIVLNSLLLRALRRIGYGLSNTYVNGSGAPPWTGFDDGERIIRLEIPTYLSTTSFEIVNDKQRMNDVIECAAGTTSSMLPKILPRH